MDKDIHIRVSEHLRAVVASAAHTQKTNISKFVRANAESAAAILRKSPYFALSTRHILYVSHNGHVFYRRLEELLSNRDIDTIACGIQMRAERSRFFMSKPSAQLDAIRKQWIFNRFSLSKEEPVDSGDMRIATASDRHGVTAKLVQFTKLGLGPGDKFWRESLVGLRDYVQWKDDSDPLHTNVGTHDFADFPMDVPSIGNVGIYVIVDKELFRNTTGHEIEPTLRWRNREFAALLQEIDIADYPNRKIGKTVSVSLKNKMDTGLRDALEKAEGEIKIFRRRLAGIRASPQSLIRALDHFPEEVLFYHLQILWPRVDIVPTIGWPRPARVTIAST